MMPDGQTDVWSYNLQQSVGTPVTDTPDSEYSSTVLPNQTHLSCIVQRKATGDQDLVSYLLTNPEQTELILESQKMGKIGYQAWLNADEAVVFVLGTPQTMHYLNRKAGRDTVIAGQIGRSLHHIPGQQAVSYVQQVGETWRIRSYDPARNQVRDITTSDSGSEHYNAWLNTGTLLESRGTELWAFSTKTKQWQAVPLPPELPPAKSYPVSLCKANESLWYLTSRPTAQPSCQYFRVMVISRLRKGRELRYLFANQPCL